MNETPKACPHCEAEQHPVLDDRYDCHTHILGDVGKPCLMYQLAAKDRELNAVRGELEDVKQALSDGDAARDRVRWDGDTNMAACRKERDELRAANAGLLEALNAKTTT